MKRKFKRLLSALSAITVTVTAFPVMALSAIAEDEISEEIVDE